jgi:hypothetical protein
MSSGPVNPFVDFGSNPSDTNENNAASIQPVADGEGVNQTVLRRPTDNMRQRSEVIRGRLVDSLFLENADRVLLISGPGKITWPGSTTAGANGIPVISDVLWILPMLTPGFAQAQPVPPVASAFGVIHLKRATGPSNAIAVTSQRRSYAAGDQINITVTPGGVYSCTLDVEDTGALRRTIKIVATGATTLGTVIASLNGLTPPAPDNTQLVSAALEGGALAGDLILTSQARQFMSGNYDGEGHTITPANLASFFSTNPGQVLAEGDSLCVAYADLFDTASNGGRRQSIPENSNTAIPAGSFFNSRVHPELLFNALPVCKVVNGSLVFGTGVEIPAGETNASLSAVNTLSPLIRNGGFEHGVTNDTGRYGITNWENRPDLAVGGAWRLGATAVDTGGKSLEFNKTIVGASTARVEQVQEIPVIPGNNVKISVRVKQLIAPTAGTYIVGLYWGDADSAASGSSSMAFQVLASTDGAFRTVSAAIAVPAGKKFLKLATVEVVGVTAASTGVALAVDNLQVSYEGQAVTDTKSIDEIRVRPVTADAVIIEDPTTYQLGQLAALLRFDKSAPASEGSLIVERRDQTYPNLPPVLAHYGRLFQLGAKLLDTEARALLPRVSADISVVGGVELTLLWESGRQGEGVGTYTQPALRVYAAADGRLLLTNNARFDGTNWNKDVTGQVATKLELQRDQLNWMKMDSATASWAYGSWQTLYRSTTTSPISVLEFQNSDLAPSNDGTMNVGQSAKAFAAAWVRNARIGPAITDAPERLVQYKSNFNYPTQTDQVDFDYISANFGTLSRKGHRFVQDWDSNAAAPLGWTTSSTGGATGSNTLGAAQHRTTVAHDGANAGTFTLQTINSVKFRLTDGFMCRIRMAMLSTFASPYVGFFDVGGNNGITFGPRTVDGGGAHNYQFAVGAGLTLAGGPGDHVWNANMRWLSFAVVGTRLWWTADYQYPDDPGSGSFDSFPVSGGSTITVPTGLYHFVITAHGAGAGNGSSINVDYVEIISGGRDA